MQPTTIPHPRSRAKHCPAWAWARGRRPQATGSPFQHHARAYAHVRMCAYARAHVCAVRTSMVLASRSVRCCSCAAFCSCRCSTLSKRSAFATADLVMDSYSPRGCPRLSVFTRTHASHATPHAPHATAATLAWTHMDSRSRYGHLLHGLVLGVHANVTAVACGAGARMRVSRRRTLSTSPWRRCAPAPQCRGRPLPPYSRFPDRRVAGFPRVCAVSICTSGACPDRAHTRQTDGLET